jgi:UDP-N-acetylmuramate dehydrogenase
LLSVIEKKGVEPTLRSIREVVVDMRQSKLPEPSVLGSAGSFFKNPIISIDQFKCIKERYPNVPFFEVGEEKIKIPAGWLIEQCGWKGKRVGSVGVYDKQALVLVNYGGATGRDIENLANDICLSVLQEFGLKIEPEVCFIR